MQDADEGAAAGRKRDFAAIAGQDSLLGPGGGAGHGVERSLGGGAASFSIHRMG